MSNNNLNEISTDSDYFLDFIGVAAVFKAYDLNNDGFIDKDELQNAMKKMVEQDRISKDELDEAMKEADRMMREADRNGDGRIDYNEFARFVVKEMFGSDVESLSSEEEDEEDLLAKFKEIDLDGDGFIDINELRARAKLDGVDISEAELKVMVCYGDSNGDGKIDFDEFVKMYREEEQDDEQMMLSTFRTFDLNNDGFIDKEEFRTVMKTLDAEFTEEHLEELMKKGDVDGNGQIDYAEFIKLWNE